MTAHTRISGIDFHVQVVNHLLWRQLCPSLHPWYVGHDRSLDSDGDLGGASIMAAGSDREEERGGGSRNLGR
jgi:hypothetical protein